MKLAIEYAGDYQRAYMEAYSSENPESARANSYRLIQDDTIRKQIDDGLNELSDIRKQATIEATREHAKDVVLSRERCLEIASKIAKGSVRRHGSRVIVPNDTERLKAVEMLWKMQNFDGLDEDKNFGVIKPELPKAK